MPRKGCTHSRDPKTKKCRSKKQHDSRMRRLAKRTASKRAARLSKALEAYVQKRRSRRSAMKKARQSAKAYSAGKLVTTRL